MPWGTFLSGKCTGERGQLIDIECDGEWYPGLIDRCLDLTFDVTYWEEGDWEGQVQGSRIRVRDKLASSYQQMLRKLYRKEADATEPFMSPEFWLALLGDDIETQMKLTVDGEGQPVAYKAPSITSENGTSNFNDDMNKVIIERGFCMVKAVCSENASASISARRSAAPLPSIAIDWASRRPLLQKIANCIEMLKAKGWPPAFVFMYDEPWELVDGLFDLMQPVLGDDCVLDASVFAWGLDRGSRTEHVGGNFKLPHRDAAYSDVHDKQGRPINLSVWMCINEVTLDNGCMYVLPKEADPLFAKEDSSYHMEPAFASKTTPGLDVNFDLDCVVPQPGPPGSVLCWTGNLVHWGSSCSAYAADPRKNIAMAFRVSPNKVPFAENEYSETGRPPLTREEARKLGLQDRLSVVAASLLAYAHWFPDFSKFEPAHLGLSAEASAGGVNHKMYMTAEEETEFNAKT
jgi:hypothetical protein